MWAVRLGSRSWRWVGPAPPGPPPPRSPAPVTVLAVPMTSAPLAGSHSWLIALNPGLIKFLGVFPAQDAAQLPVSSCPFLTVGVRFQTLDLPFVLGELHFRPAPSLNGSRLPPYGDPQALRALREQRGTDPRPHPLCAGNILHAALWDLLPVP